MHLRRYEKFGVDPTAIKGIGIQTGLILLTEVGPDLSRFKSENHFCPWLGNCPENRIKEQLGGIAYGRIMQAGRGYESLARACKEIGIPRLCHHDFRHLFATRCIESGVDILTVSRWLGHQDGRALAMKTYGHLRYEHSRAMVQKVKF